MDASVGCVSVPVVGNARELRQLDSMFEREYEPVGVNHKICFADFEGTHRKRLGTFVLHRRARMFHPSRIRVIALLVFVGLCSQHSVAQTIDDVGQWNAVFSQGKLGNNPDSKLKWWFDGHVRLLDDADGFNQSIVRPGIGWGLNENSSIWAGYGWIRTSPLDDGDDFDEHRIWQQWTWSKEAKPFKVAARTRFEQRLVETGDDTGLRLRQFFRIQKTLPTELPMTLVLWDEIFLDLNDTDFGQRSGFDQNRVFVGFGFKRSKSSRWRAEIGYINQSINSIGPTDRSNHILAVNLFRSP